MCSVNLLQRFKYHNVDEISEWGKNMRKKFISKVLGIGVIVLFVGTSILSSVSGNIEKTGDRTNKEYFSSLPLSDGLLAYWKFDEGVGNILHDYSGHDYHGIIYGATWAGTSGLIFDGIDDYVDFDNHSENLGYNKTDDYIITVWFKSTSSSTGTIYSMSHTDNSNAFAYLDLNANGSLSYQMGNETCELAVYSAVAVNDGQYHYVEVIFYGNTTNPTLEIYVDSELEGRITKWVPPFFNYDFKTAKMGRKSSEKIDYYDGVIYEVKIFKYPSGNQPPNVSISGPTRGEAGVEYNYTFLTIDPEGDDIWLCIDWGDGTPEEWIGPYESGEEAVMRIAWPENGTYVIRAKARDFWGEGQWSSYIVIIGNRVPNPPVIVGPPSGKVGVELTFTFHAYDPDGDDVRYFIKWGDNNSEWTDDYYPSCTNVTIKHIWEERGDYVISVKAEDIYGAESDWGILDVTIPKNKLFVFNFPVLNWLFKRFPNAFPIIRYMLGL